MLNLLSYITCAAKDDSRPDFGKDFIGAGTRRKIEKIAAAEWGKLDFILPSSRVVFWIFSELMGGQMPVREKILC